MPKSKKLTHIVYRNKPYADVTTAAKAEGVSRQAVLSQLQRDARAASGKPRSTASEKLRAKKSYARKVAVKTGNGSLEKKAAGLLKMTVTAKRNPFKGDDGTRHVEVVKRSRLRRFIDGLLGWPSDDRLCAIEKDGVARYRKAVKDGSFDRAARERRDSISDILDTCKRNLDLLQDIQKSLAYIEGYLEGQASVSKPARKSAAIKGRKRNA